MYDRYQDWRLDVDNMTYEVRSPLRCICVAPLPSVDDQTLPFLGVGRAWRQNWIRQHRVT